MFGAVSMAVLVASGAALFFKRARILGAIGLVGSLVAIAFAFSRGAGEPVQFEGALGAVQILSLRDAPETTTPETLRYVAEQRCGVRTQCQIVIHPDSETAQQALADNAPDQGAVALYMIDMNQARAALLTRCGVWTDDPEACFTPPGE